MGGGVFGAAAALELRRRGHDVVVIAPGPLPHPDAASTDISKLVRSDYGVDGFYTDLATHAIDGWEEWNRAWPAPPYHPDGLLVLAGDVMRFGEFEHASHASLSSRGQPVERLTPDEFALRFPAWNPAVFRDGYLSERAGWAESGEVVARLIEECRAAGVRFLEDRVLTLLEGGRGPGVRTVGGAELRGEHLLIAAGAWTPSLLPELEPLMWPTGHPVLHFQVGTDPRLRVPAFPPWTYDIANTGMYGFPALPDGTMKVARHAAGFRAQPGSAGVAPDEEARFREFLARHVPLAADAPLMSTRLCFYCDTFDGDFWIDRHPDRPGVTVAAGGSGHGFKFAPVLGEIIADAVEDGDNPWARRFRWRVADAPRTEHARAKA